MMSTTPTVRRAIAVAVLASGAALVTACGPSGSSANPGTTVTVTASPSSVPPGSGPASPASGSAAPVTSPPAPAGPPPCATRDLRAKPGLAQGAAGSTYQVIDFTNISGATCTLYGYPGVAFAGGSPVKQIGLPASEDPATPRQLVTLGPGAVANALLRIVEAVNFPASKCDLVTATYLQIYPPNQTTPIYLAYTAQACAKPVRTLTVDVVKPGSGG